MGQTKNETGKKTRKPRPVSAFQYDVPADYLPGFGEIVQ